MAIFLGGGSMGIPMMIFWDNRTTCITWDNVPPAPPKNDDFY